MRFGDQIAADRYSYIAMMGVVVVLAAGLGRIGPMGLRSWLVAAGWTAASLGLLLGLILLSRDQCRTWRTSITLWTHALCHGASRSYAAHANMGLALFDEGRLGQAREELVEAAPDQPRICRRTQQPGIGPESRRPAHGSRVRIRLGAAAQPPVRRSHNNRGVLLKTQGQLDEAQAEFAAAPRLDPLSATAHCNLGMLLGRQGRVREGAEEFSRALWINPDYADAHNNLGVLRYQQGQLAMARMEFVEALRINPGSARAHANLGVLLGQQGRLEDARREFSEALRINPAFADAQNKLELVRRAQSQIDTAGAQPDHGTK